MTVRDIKELDKRGSYLVVSGDLYRTALVCLSERLEHDWSLRRVGLPQRAGIDVPLDGQNLASHQDYLRAKRA